MYAVDWDVEDIYQATTGLKNFDILCKGQHIGVVRLSFETKIRMTAILINTKKANKNCKTRCIEKG
ncbi:hypothetical protein P20429_2359 [Pseudoalteromonas sp. BSi20429]|nr:hypothetical protein P20429_2359 [Pseudoalteromonas sp. BSi20429]